MKYLIIYFLILTSVHRAFSQTVVGMEVIPEKAIKPWAPASLKELEGIYHFGESEAESTLALVITDGVTTAQIRSGEWVQIRGVDKWRFIYRTLSNVKIESGKFYSTEATGEFVSVVAVGKKDYGLRIRKPWSASVDKGKAEIGIKTLGVKDYYEGDYPQASYQILQADELSKYDKIHLAIIRNEIFARYGYIFSNSNGMLTFFKKQKWYEPVTTNVSRCLTEIERRNISLLKKLEAKI